MTDHEPDRIAERLRCLGEEMAAQGRPEDAIAAYFGALAVLFDDERVRHGPSRPAGVAPAVLVAVEPTGVTPLVSRAVALAPEHRFADAG